MAVQPTPPIQLDPSMDRGHELAFINQNFNNIASVIGQNSFVIVQSGTTTTPSFSLTALGTGYQANQSSSATITHNLGFAPILWAFVSGAGGYVPFPNQGYNVSSGAGGGFILDWYTSFVDTTTLAFNHDAVGFNNTTTFVTSTIKYYLLQQTQS